jgi:hypothetical protein
MLTMIGMLIAGCIACLVIFYAGGWWGYLKGYAAATKDYKEGDFVSEAPILH